MIRNKMPNRQSKEWLIVLIALAGEFLTQRLNLLLLLAISVWCLIKRKRLSIAFPGKYYYAYMLITGMIIGLYWYLSGRYSLYIFSKHVYFFVLPFLYWFIGCELLRKNKNTDFLRAIIWAATIFSVYDLVNIALVVLKNGIVSLYAYRILVGTGSFLPLIGLYILLFYKHRYQAKASTILICLYAIVFLAHFSRTYILEILILVLFSGIHYNWRKILRVTVLLAASVVVMYVAFPETIGDFLLKLLSSLTEINFGNSGNVTWNVTSINQNWRGYEMYCEMIKFNSSSLFEKVLGGGFGATLDVFGYASFVTTEDELNILHNGYGTQLMIWGIVGIVIFFLWISKIYAIGSRMKDAQDGRLVRGIAICTLVTTYFVMGPLFNQSRAIYLFYVALIFANNRLKKHFDHIKGKPSHN